MRRWEKKIACIVLVVILLELSIKSYAISTIVENSNQEENIQKETLIENDIQSNVKQEEKQTNQNLKETDENHKIQESDKETKNQTNNKEQESTYRIETSNNVSDTYVGNINSELKRFDMKQAGNGAHYVSGEIVIVEWVDGVSTVPEVLPKITLKSTDGLVSYESFITPTGTNTYYFDQYIEDIDHSKEYVYELESGNPKNVSENKKMQITISNKELGNIKKWKAKIEGNTLKFVPDTYIGNISSELKRFNMKQAANGAHYISGEIVIVEWVDGVSTVPEVLPKITLKSTDGTVRYESFITPTGTNTYYFDQYIEDINHSKEYIYELESGNPKNVSEKKKGQVKIQNQELGIVKDWKVKIENNTLKFREDTYIGNISSELKRFDMEQAANGAHYISGEIVIIEWIDGKSTVPEVLPKIRLKSTDGMVSYESFITPTGTNTYYFDQYIEDINHEKEYIYELESGNPKNVSEKKKGQVTIQNKELGIVKDWIASIADNKLIFKLDAYLGNVTNQLTKFSISNNGEGYSYISGELIFIEWVDGVSTVPEKLPEIRLVSEDGKNSYDMFVKQLSGNTYYFDLWIEGLVSSDMKYYIETESGDRKNISPDRKRKLDFGEKTGEYKNYRYTFQLEEDQTIEVKIESYEGEVVATLEQFNLVTDGKHYSYIEGVANIKEKVDGEEFVSEFLPKVRLKSTDKTKITQIKVSKSGNSTYSFRIPLDYQIDAEKDYYFEVESGDLRNGSDKKIAIMDLRNKVGEYKNFKYTLTINESNQIEVEQESYTGDVTTQYLKLNLTSNYLTGEAVVVEWVNGQSTVPEFNPMIRLKSTDNTVNIEMFVKQQSGNTYYFDSNISGIDLKKTYYIEISSGDLRNVSEKQTKQLKIPNGTIAASGIFQGNVLNSQITFSKRSYIEGIYGSSGLKIAGDARGSDLRYYQIGNGPNVAFMVFEAHGFEDLWDHDGQELIEIAEQLKTKLVSMNDQELQNKWTIYIIPEANPDGVRHGWTNNGPGRQTLYGALENDGHKGIDMNRCWHISGTSYTQYDGRNYNGSEGFSAYEARSLRDFLLNHKSVNGQTILVELHGWTNQVIGDQEIGAYYKNEFPTCRPTPSYGVGYLVNWARASLGNSSRVARSALIELPSEGITNHQSVVNAGYADRFINATINMLRGIV